MNTLRILVSLGLLVSACIAHDVSLKNKVSKRTQCGGSITSDSEIIEYPGPGETLVPGEVCIWTIHLNSTQNFRLNFTKFDIQSTSPAFDCADTGIRLYSLTNLVPPDRLENYTFCSDVPPPNNFIVSGNVISVVLYSSNARPGSGFVLKFDGNSFDPFGTTHLSTFSNTPSGLIGYPIQGTYPMSMVATWTVEVPGNSTTSNDLNILSVGLQSCTNPDPCTCDALIVFEISDAGLLSVRERLCSSSTNNLIQNTSPRFIIGFFSDSLTQPGNGTGFQLQYYPSLNPPTTGRPDINIPCGTVINDIETAIAFKETVQYGQHERCVWTIRVEGASNYRLTITDYGVTNLRDGLSISGFRRSEFPAVTEEVHVTSEGVYEVRGDLAILTFHTGATSAGFGFVGSITALFYTPTDFYSSNYIFTDAAPFTFNYPSVGNYHNNELSTFVYAPNSEGDTGRLIRAELTNNGLETCSDSVAVLLFTEALGTGGTWLNDKRFCNNETSYLVQSRDLILFSFRTDASYVSEGFKIFFG